MVRHLGLVSTATGVLHRSAHVSTTIARLCRGVCLILRQWIGVLAQATASDD